eukprot:166589-Prymnesium_polylepis.1
MAHPSAGLSSVRVMCALSSSMPVIFSDRHTRGRPKQYAGSSAIRANSRCALFAVAQCLTAPTSV